MAGYQFIHLQTHPLVRSTMAGPDATRPVDEIMAEAFRLPGSCEHVASRQLPRVQGVPIDALIDELGRRVQEAGRISGRAIRKDRRVLVSMVTSHPTPTHQIEEETFDNWAKSSINWARSWAKAHHLDFFTAVHHRDEAYPHLHIYFLPRPDNGMKADNCHPGKVAKKMAEGQARNTGLSGKDVTRAGNKAYKAAMVEFQDEYWEKVSLDAGLTRTGPRRKRLSRGDWQREKASATRLARARRDAEALADRQAALEARTQVLEERESALDQQVIQMQAWTASREEALDTGCVAVKYALEALADQLPAEVADNIKRFLNQAEGIVAAAAVINAMSLRRAEATCASDNAAYSGLEMDRRSSFNSLPGQT